MGRRPLAEVGDITVPGDGPRDAEVCFLGEAPGKDEIREGRPFVGASGRVLWPLAERFGSFHRERIRVENMVEVRLPDDDAAKHKLLDPVWQEITTDVDERLSSLPNLKLIVTLGAWATRAVLDVDLEWAHGMAYCDRDGKIVAPAYHPAAGIRQPAYLGLLAWDLQRAHEARRGKLKCSEEPAEFTVPVYPDRFRRTGIYALDTEGTPGQPLCLTIANDLGDVNLARAEDCSKFMFSLRGALVILHNALWDIPVLRAMGIDLQGHGCKVIDTMMMAYHLCHEPQSLKALAARHCGLLMQEYAEVVDRIRGLELTAWLTAKAADAKNITTKDYTRVAKLLHKYTESYGELWAAWRRSNLKKTLGEPPPVEPQLLNTPEFREYAMKDAYATMKVYQALRPIYEAEVGPLEGVLL